MTQNSQIQNLLTKGVSNIIDRENLEKKLESGEKLTIKFGIDPTAAKVHIGHMVPFLKLKEFQKMGHKIVLLFGDATAQVGDTSDKDAERPMLTRDETRANAEAFLQKFSKVIDIDKIEIYYNSEGLDAVNFAGVGELAKNFSVAEMLDRDNFSKRYKGGKRISLQEFLYPIMQGYDSVCIARKYGACDLELGGNDQYFNLLAGRRIMGAFDIPKQDIMTFDLLLGTDGEKMSKTKPNCILIDEAPQSMYQKLINVKDDMIIHYFELATDATLEEIETIKTRLADGEHPNNIKKELAQRIITMYHGKPYDENDISNVELISLGENEMVADGKITIANLLKAVKFCATSGDVRNAVSGGSVRLDGEKIEDIRQEVTLSNEQKLLQMGKKKAVRVTL
ncbi:tyrosine--tRNA ligase [Candidatus Gracilibacteria bacterium]|nr:tyrosine--tRNA ligase [Candidatus Gracilibacteria bacterium]